MSTGEPLLGNIKSWWWVGGGGRGSPAIDWHPNQGAEVMLLVAESRDSTASLLIRSIQWIEHKTKPYSCHGYVI